MNDVTRILSAIEQGDSHAAEELLPLVYEELRQLAAQKLASEKPGQTLEATALVHEAYLRLVGESEKQHWDGRGHFFAAASTTAARLFSAIWRGRSKACRTSCPAVCKAIQRVSPPKRCVLGVSKLGTFRGIGGQELSAGRLRK